MRELLSTQDSISVEDVKYMQMDFYSYFAHDVTPFLLQAYDSVTVQDPEIKIVLRYFRNWHFQLLKDDVPTMIFHATLTHLLQNTFQDEMGKELYEHYVFIANMPYRVILTLLSDNNAQWFDDISTPTVETRDEIIRKSINQALTDLRQRIGGEMREWRWGTLHTITFPHLFGNHKPLDKVFNIGPYEIGGSGTSLNNGEYRFSEPYEVTLGPSMRKIVDFADLNDALSVIPCGQSGQPFHDHYADQAPLWLHGEYHQLPLDSASIEPLIVHRLRLIPASHD
jgi:penicillin amidase